VKWWCKEEDLVEFCEVYVATVPPGVKVKRWCKEEDLVEFYEVYVATVPPGVKVKWYMYHI
jgi:hypothetical protein